jgi:hypothetical protein
MITRKSLLRGSVLCIVLALAMVALFGCAALRKPTAGHINKTVTTVIADAGAAAQQAEALYQAGTIAQTKPHRTAINELVTAYNDAKTAYTLLLTAEQAYQGAANTQLASCSPAAGKPASGPTCAAATATAATAKKELDVTQGAFASQVSTLQAKTAAVTSLAKQ